MANKSFRRDVNSFRAKREGPLFRSGYLQGFYIVDAYSKTIFIFSNSVRWFILVVNSLKLSKHFHLIEIR